MALDEHMDPTDEDACGVELERCDYCGKQIDECECEPMHDFGDCIPFGEVD